MTLGHFFKIAYPGLEEYPDEISHLRRKQTMNLKVSELVEIQDALLIMPSFLVEDILLQRCRVCGCVQDNCEQCIKKTGHPCTWVEDDLCSACAKE